ncbi:hypothetical protein ACHAQH_009784 [Verticillium albo-atrum]
MTPGADEGPARSRRGTRPRPKKSAAQAVDNNDDLDLPDMPDNKKKRGRPKLDTDDRTAKDRRRTQIRLAQRAYRGRKEEAILDLMKQVEELKRTNEQMSNAFMRLYDYAMSQGMPKSLPEFGRQLQATTQTFLALAQSTSEQQQAPAEPRHESEEMNTDSPDSDSEKQQRKATGSPDAAATDAVNTTNVGQQILMAGIMVSHEQDPTYDEATGSEMAIWARSAQTPSSAPAYEIVTQPTVHNASFPFGTSTSTPAETLAATTLALSTPNMQSSGPRALGLAPALSPPPSLSYQERTFGRRLQRRAVEQAVGLMSMPDPPPETVAGVFGFCLLFESRDRIIERLANCLSVNHRETLNNWRHPFLHLGGAGTFFQEPNDLDSLPLARDIKAKGAELEDALVDAIPPRLPVGNEGTDEPLRSKLARESNFGQGPWSQEVEETRDLRVDHRLRITTPGFEGDFFDTDEVEWYLHQRGVVIPPAADFVSAEIDDTTFGRTPQATADSTAPEKSSAWTPGDFGAAGSSLAPTPVSNSDNWSAPTVTGEEEIEALLAAPLPPTLMDVSLPVDPMLYDLSNLGPDKPPTPRKRRVNINIEILVEQLIQRSVCLGRTPGMRPKDVDAAFWQAVF